MKAEPYPTAEGVEDAIKGAAYSKTARTVPYCADVENIDAASDLVAALIDPALDGTATGRTWRSEERVWSG